MLGFGAQRQDVSSQGLGIGWCWYKGFLCGISEVASRPTPSWHFVSSVTSFLLYLQLPEVVLPGKPQLAEFCRLGHLQDPCVDTSRQIFMRFRRLRSQPADPCTFNVRLPTMVPKTHLTLHYRSLENELQTSDCTPSSASTTN